MPLGLVLQHAVEHIQRYRHRGRQVIRKLRAKGVRLSPQIFQRSSRAHPYTPLSSVRLSSIDSRDSNTASYPQYGPRPHPNPLGSHPPDMPLASPPHLRPSRLISPARPRSLPLRETDMTVEVFQVARGEEQDVGEVEFFGTWADGEEFGAMAGALSFLFQWVDQANAG